MRFQLPIPLFALAIAAGADMARAQDEDEAEPETESSVLSVIDSVPIASVRAAAMGGAIVTVADDLDAAFHNPAGIGGLGWEKKKLPAIRKLYFPHASMGGNVRSADLIQDIRSERATSDSAAGKALTDAHAGQRQYGRIGLLGGGVFGRTILVPFTDMQIAATSHGEGSHLIDLKSSTVTGVGAGFSAQDEQGVFSLGYFGYSAQRSVTDGTFTYEQITDKELRTEAFDDVTTKSSALGHNAGVIWRLGKKARPTLGVSLKNIGGTTYAASGDGEDVVQPQDLTIGFSLSPDLGKTGRFNFVLAADRLDQDEISFTKKYRAGFELLWRGLGSYATAALRAGLNDAGASGGVSLNLGLIGLEAASHAVDIGAGNEKVIERRFIGSLFVNVAEF